MGFSARVGKVGLSAYGGKLGFSACEGTIGCSTYEGKVVFTHLLQCMKHNCGCLRGRWIDMVLHDL